MKSFALIVLSVLAVIGCIDRLRVVNWKTVKFRFIALYLLFAIWSLAALYEGTIGESDWKDVVGLLGVIILFVATRKTWKKGPPDYTMTPFGELYSWEIKKHSGGLDAGDEEIRKEEKL